MKQREPQGENNGTSEVPRSSGDVVPRPPDPNRSAAMNRLLFPRHLTRTALALLVLMVPAKLGSAQDGIKPLPPDEKAFGLTLGEWGAALMQWILSIPASVNPESDPTGIRAGIGQRMPVWFLPAAPLGLSFQRRIIIPAGYAILYGGPVNLLYAPPGKATEEQLRADLGRDNERFLGKISLLEISVNGVPVPDLNRYRVPTPLFTLVLPPGNLLGVSVTAGKDQRAAAVAEGYFMLLPSLPVGKHVIQVRMKGIHPDTSAPYEEQRTYDLIVQNSNDPLP
jgi:hypothetical protein